MTPIPAFYYRKAVANDGAVLEEGDGFVINRRYGVVSIDCRKPWKPEYEKAYRHHDAEGVLINSFSMPGWEGRSLDFLLDLPGLRQLSLNVHFPMDISPLGNLIGLESLTLGFSPGTLVEPPARSTSVGLSGSRSAESNARPGFCVIPPAWSIEVLFLD